MLNGNVRGNGSLGIGYNLSLAGIFTWLRPGTGALRGVGNCDRFWAGRGAHAVVMTFITCEFSGGPWTSAVQGAKIINIFLTAKNAEIAEKKRDLLPRKGAKERKNGEF